MEEGLEKKKKQVFISLLKGPIFKEQHSKQWNDLLLLRDSVNDYFFHLNLQLYLDEDEGYAFLKEIGEEGDDEKGESRLGHSLVSKRPLGFFPSLICALFRKKLIEHEVSGNGLRLIIKREEIYNMLEVYNSGPQTNQVKFNRQVDGYLKKLEEIGIVRFVNEKEKVEVKRIIKALVDTHWLGKLDSILEEYQDYATGSS